MSQNDIKEQRIREYKPSESGFDPYFVMVLLRLMPIRPGLLNGGSDVWQTAEIQTVTGFMVGGNHICTHKTHRRASSQPLLGTVNESDNIPRNTNALFLAWW